MTTPNHVTIGTQRYNIQERHPNDDGGLSDALAYTLVESNLIVLNRDLPGDRKRAILIHEILHAIIYTFSRLDKPDKLETFDDWEHHFIAIVQEPLAMVIRDNPHLLTWLTQPYPASNRDDATNNNTSTATAADRNKKQNPR